MKSQKTTKLLPAYNNIDLARKVRQQATSLIRAFDPGNTGTFRQEDLIKILRTFIEADQTELRYVTSNMFRYDKDNDGLINCLELINFFLEVSWGEIAIQRLHRKGYYKNGSARMIQEQEFFNTLQYILSFIKLETNEVEGKLLFKDIDTNNDGLISYNQYFTFLRTYFGSQSQAANEEQSQGIPKKPQLPVDLLFDGRDRFKRLILSQSKLVFIAYNVSRDLEFTKQEIKTLLEQVFLVQSINLQPMTQRLANTNSLNDFDRLTSLLVMLQFGEVVLGKLHNDGSLLEWRTRRLNKQDFIKVIRTGCSYMNVFPDRQLISNLFQFISIDDAPIPYSTYRQFIISLFATQKQEMSFVREDIIDPIGLIRQKVIKIKSCGDNQLVHQACWKELEKIFKKHNMTGAGLNKGELADVIGTIFRNIDGHKRNVLVWSAFNHLETSTMRFNDFVPWILKKLFHYGFVSFYENEKAPAGLKMSLEEFKRFMRTVYWFIPNELEDQYEKLYNSISQNPDRGVDRNQILGWVTARLTVKH